MLWSVNIYRSIGIRERTIPMCSHGGRTCITEWRRFSYTVSRVEDLNPSVREIGVCHHHRAVGATDSVPGIERSDPSLHSCIDMYTPNAMWPIDKGEFSCGWNPRFVGDPLIPFDVSGI